MQEVKHVYVDCDADTILLKVHQIGGAACHTGFRSCFYREVQGDSLKVIGRRSAAARTAAAASNTPRSVTTSMDPFDGRIWLTRTPSWMATPCLRQPARKACITSRGST